MSGGSPGVPQMRGLFAKVLELPDDLIADDTDFFVAGGHSLSALTLAMAIEELYLVPVKVHDVFELATPQRLHAHATAAAPAPRQEQASTVDVNPAAAWLWMERQRGETPTGAYNVACLLRVEGHPDPERLGRAIDEVHRAHPALRTVFVEDQGRPRPLVRPHGSRMRLIEVGADAYQTTVDDLANTPFDPATGPLTRTTLLHRVDGGPELLIVTDHLVCDGRGLAILAEDLVRAYGSGGLAVEPPGPVRLPDPQRPIDYWRAQLQPFPQPLPLPVYQPRRSPIEATEIVRIALDAEVVERLTGRARLAHGGVFAGLAASVAHALARLTGSTDICLGTAVDLRGRQGLERTIGFHVATVPLRLSVPEGIGAQQLVADVADRVMNAVDHSEVSFGELVAALNPPRIPWRNPLFDAWVALYPFVAAGSVRQDGIALRGGPLPLRHGMFELSFQFAERADGLDLLLQYDIARYDRETVRRLAHRVEESLRWLVDDPSQAPAGLESRVFSGFRFDA